MRSSSKIIPACRVHIESDLVACCCCCTDNPDRIKLARSNLDFVLSPSLMLVVGLTINSIPVVGPPRQWNTRAKRAKHHLRSKNWSRCRYVSHLTMGNVSQVKDSEICADTLTVLCIAHPVMSHDLEGPLVGRNAANPPS